MKDKTDEERKDILKTMLKKERDKDGNKITWRNLSTLMHVIGADEETTKKLLLESGARASENGQELWGLIKRNPLE